MTRNRSTNWRNFQGQDQWERDRLQLQAKMVRQAIIICQILLRQNTYWKSFSSQSYPPMIQRKHSQLLSLKRTYPLQLKWCLSFNSDSRRINSQSCAIPLFLTKGRHCVRIEEDCIHIYCIMMRFCKDQGSLHMVRLRSNKDCQERDSRLRRPARRTRQALCSDICLMFLLLPLFWSIDSKQEFGAPPLSITL